MPSVRYSAEIRSAAVARVLSHQTSASQTARDLGCSINSLHSWIKKYRQQQEQPNPSPEQASFVPVQVIASNPSIEIITPNGYTVRLNAPLALGELLAALAAC